MNTASTGWVLRIQNIISIWGPLVDAILNSTNEGTTIIRIVWLTVRRGANLIWELKGYTQVVRDVQVQSGLKGISFLCKPCHFKWLTDNNNNIISEWVINHYSHGFDFMNWLTFFFPREGKDSICTPYRQESRKIHIDIQFTASF